MNKEVCNCTRSGGIDEDMRPIVDALYDALADLVFLHGCEQEGIESAMPTPDQWEQAVDNAVIALKGAKGESWKKN